MSETRGLGEGTPEGPARQRGGGGNQHNLYDALPRGSAWWEQAEGHWHIVNSQRPAKSLDSLSGSLRRRGVEIRWGHWATPLSTLTAAPDPHPETTRWPVLDRFYVTILRTTHGLREAPGRSPFEAQRGGGSGLRSHRHEIGRAGI